MVGAPHRRARGAGGGGAAAHPGPVHRGFALTALVQSSSATTLTTIGFVRAGLLGFEQAIGGIVGASPGTTGTGWLVSVLS